MRDLIAGGLLLASSAAFGAPPTAISATYQVSKDGQPFATATEKFTQADKRYRIESETRGTGVYGIFLPGAIRLISVGEVTSEGLRPAHFEYHRGSDERKKIVADFDWTAKTLTSQQNGKTETQPLEGNVQDRISQLYSFVFNPPGNEDLKLAMTNGKTVSQYSYQFVGEQKLDTPAGRYQTLHYKLPKTPEEDGKELWLAKELGYFPVKIVIDERSGGKLEQVATRVRLEKGGS